MVWWWVCRWVGREREGVDRMCGTHGGQIGAIGGVGEGLCEKKVNASFEQFVRGEECACGGDMLRAWVLSITEVFGREL